MPADEPPPIPTYETRSDKRLASELVSNCIAVSTRSGKVVIATRTFPAEDYEYDYSEYDVSIACAKLNLLGYATETRITMDDRCSKIVLCVDNLTQRKREVRAERLIKGLKNASN